MVGVPTARVVMVERLMHWYDDLPFFPLTSQMQILFFPDKSC